MSKSLFALFLVLLLVLISSEVFGGYTNVYIVNERGTNLILAELAVTKEEKERGLMFRKTLGTNEGMLFIFEKPSYLSFWMKNTYLSLGIVFIDENLRVIDVFYPDPLSTVPVGPSAKSLYVLEILKSTSMKLNIKKGDKVKFE